MTTIHSSNLDYVILNTYGIFPKMDQSKANPNFLETSPMTAEIALSSTH
jgi:hypothetical protein